MKITDKMRLDWFNKHPASVKPYLECGWIANIGPLSDGSWKPTLRRAIDAAIRAEKKARGDR